MCSGLVTHSQQYLKIWANCYEKRDGHLWMHWKVSPTNLHFFLLCSAQWHVEMVHACDKLTVSIWWLRWLYWTACALIPNHLQVNHVLSLHVQVSLYASNQAEVLFFLHSSFLPLWGEFFHTFPTTPTKVLGLWSRHKVRWNFNLVLLLRLWYRSPFHFSPKALSYLVFSWPPWLPKLWKLSTLTPWQTQSKFFFSVFFSVISTHTSVTAIIPMRFTIIKDKWINNLIV